MKEKEYLDLIEKSKPLLNQIGLNICLCNKDGKIVFVNDHAASSLKSLGELIGFSEIKTGYDVVGTDMSKWHKLTDFKGEMEKRNGQWGKWHIKGARWRSRSSCVRDDNGNIIGYIGAWEELDQGASEDDNTEKTYDTVPYKRRKI